MCWTGATCVALALERPCERAVHTAPLCTCKTFLLGSGSYAECKHRRPVCKGALGCVGVEQTTSRHRAIELTLLDMQNAVQKVQQKRPQ